MVRVLVVPTEEAASVAERIPGARILELPQLDAVERLVDSFTPATRVVPSPVAEQARRNAEARAGFLAELEMFDAQGVADLAGSRAENRRATASRWHGDGSCFAVEHEGRLLFPAFQFDPETRRPRPEVAEVVSALHGIGLRGWSLALWWTTPHDALSWRRPVDALRETPQDVIEAARLDARTRG